MALKNLMARLQHRAACIPDTPDTPDTSCLSDNREILQIGPFDEALAANDPNPPSEPPPDPNAWRELAAAYHAHHLNCSTCIAAGRGALYGLRCGTGMALWINYQNT